MFTMIFRSALTASFSWIALTAAAQGAGWADSLFPVKKHDFGTVAVASHTEFKFPIENRTNQDIHIASVRTSCGCTTVFIDQKWIKAGETGTLTARYNTDTFRGKRGATLTVVLDRPRYTEVQLRVDGYIRRDVVFNPGSVDFGTVNQGDPIEKSVDIAYAGRPDWQILSIESAQPFVSTAVRETSRQGQRANYELVVGVSADAPAGFLQEELVIVTNDRSMPRIPLRVTGEIQSPLTVAPQSIALGTLKPGDDATQRLVIRGREPFRVTEILCEGFEIDFVPTDEAKKTHLINVRFVANGNPGPHRGALLVHTDAGDEFTGRAIVTADIQQ